MNGHVNHIRLFMKAKLFHGKMGNIISWQND